MSRPISSSVLLAIAIVVGPIRISARASGSVHSEGAGGDRIVDRDGRSLVLARHAEGKIAGNEADAAHLGRRLLSRQRRNSRKEGHNQKAIENTQHETPEDPDHRYNVPMGTGLRITWRAGIKLTQRGGICEVGRNRRSAKGHARPQRASDRGR